MWAESQRRIYEAHWPEVERLFGSLEPSLFGQAKLAEYDLVLRHSATGEFRDVFNGADQFPILSIGGWLLEDLGVAPGPDGLAAERALFVASLLLALRVHTIAQMRDPSSFAEDGHTALVDFCTSRAKRELAALGGDGFRMSELASLLDTPYDYAGHVPAAGAAAHLSPRWSAPSLVIARAAAGAARTPDRGVSAAQILARLAAAMQIRDDLQSIDGDLHHGRMTYPIAVIAQAAGMALSARPDPTRLLGAMVATGTLPALLERAESLVAEAAGVARASSLPILASYLDAALATFTELRSRVAGGRPVHSATPRRPAPLIARYEPTLPKAIDMAARFMLADRTFRESWETHREGMLGAAEVASRYPVGLILEILERHRHDVAPEIDEFLTFTVANGFRYYDHPWSDPDTDTLGVFLRLRAGTNQPDAYTDAVDRMLRCIERRVLEEHRIPVWVRDCEPRADDRPSILALGEGCGTVAAHLLLGLLSPPSAAGATLEHGAASLVDRLCDVGVGANVNYPRLYALAVWFRLLSGLSTGPDPIVAREAIDEARARLMGDLATRIAVDAATPQGAALATIACRAAMRPDLIDQGWESTILKRQRSDGSWLGEPFAAAPNRGGWVGWYSSSTLTTALCYDALAGSSAP